MSIQYNKYLPPIQFNIKFNIQDPRFSDYIYTNIILCHLIRKNNPRTIKQGHFCCLVTSINIIIPCHICNRGALYQFLFTYNKEQKRIYVCDCVKYLYNLASDKYIPLLSTPIITELIFVLKQTPIYYCLVPDIFWIIVTNILILPF
jgi:hypothetical protein